MAKATPKPLESADPDAPVLTEPTTPSLAGGRYDEHGNQLERLEDAPPPERKE